MLIIDQNSTNTPQPSIFLHGMTGSGKSTWACKGGNPLVILTEPKAMPRLQKINPNATGFVPRSLREIRSMLVLLGELHNPHGTEMARILKAMGASDPAPLQARLSKVDRIVLDSFTDLTYNMPKWMKDPEGKEILHTLEIQEYGDLKGYALALVAAIHYTGQPSVIIARSTVKRTGRVEKVVPDGLGKAIEELPGKCLPTVEARVLDGSYFIDSTPDEFSQRCGVPEVPFVFTGSVSEMISLIVDGEAPAPVIQPPAVDAPNSATPGAFGQVVKEELEAKAQGRQEVSEEQLWGAVAGESAKSSGALAGQITVEQFTALCDMAKVQKVDIAALQTYCKQRGDLLGDTLSTMKVQSYEKFMPILRDSTRSAGLKAHLANLTKTAA